MPTNNYDCKLCKLPFHFICSSKFCLNEWIFRISGVTPHNKELRDNIDWFYLILWLASIGYQALLLLCFFIYPDLIFTIKLHNEFEISFSKILNLLSGSYITAVGGYGIFNVIHRHNLRPENNRRYRDIKVSDEKRKRRNGHRFIIYWWLNFLIMFLAIIFWDFKGGILNGKEGPETTSLVIAIDCLVLAIGFKYAKDRWS